MFTISYFDFHASSYKKNKGKIKGIIIVQVRYWSLIRFFFSYNVKMIKQFNKNETILNS